jgi:6-phosphogluconolactonase (cycloisomerase 2 family)
VSSLPNVAQLTVSRDGKTLYAASEVEKGVVQAWRIEKNGELTELNQVASGGAGPVYLSLTPDGRHLLVANYVSGSIAVLPVKEDGSLGEAVDGIRIKARGRRTPGGGRRGQLCHQRS